MLPRLITEVEQKTPHWNHLDIVFAQVGLNVLVPGYDRPGFQGQLRHCFVEGLHFTFPRPWVSQRLADLNQPRSPPANRNNEINFLSGFCLVVENLRVNTSQGDERKILQKMSGIDKNA